MLGKNIYFLIVVFSIVFSGCAQKLRMKVLTPAQVGEMATKKRVAITDFSQDSIGLSSKIESNLASHRIDNKRYFQVLARKDIDKVIAEHRLQSSSLMNVKKLSKVGELVGAQAIISGEVSSANAQVDSYNFASKQCVAWDKNHACLQYASLNITCKTVKAQVSASLNVVDIETGSLIFGDTFAKDYDGNSCMGNKYLSRAQVLEMLSSEIANEFSHKLTPNYRYFNVVLLDSLDVDTATNLDEIKLEAALKYIEFGRLSKAEEILHVLMESLDGKSYVVAYNLGVLKEAKAEYKEANNFYMLADELTIEPQEEINEAIIRVSKLKDKKNELDKQLSSN